MQIVQLSSFPIEQAGSLEQVEQRLTDWFATLTYPVRLLAFSRSFDLRPAIARLNTDLRGLNNLWQIVSPLMQAIDGLIDGESEADPSAAVAALPADELGLLLDLFTNEPMLQRILLHNEEICGDDGSMRWGILADALDSILWRLPWMKENVRFYEELQRQHLRSATYVLITWEPSEVSVGSIVGTLRQVTGRSVRVLQQLPPFLEDAYFKQPINLRPEGPIAPWLTAALAYEIQGELDATTLHTLLSEIYDVAIAIDIHTMSKEKAQRAAELAHNASRLLSMDTTILDTRAVGVRKSAERVLFDLKRQNLHTVQLAILVSGVTEDEVESNYAIIEKKLGTQIKWFRPPYHQGEILKFFSTTPRGGIEAPLRQRSSLSHGVGCLAGILGYHRADNTSGVFWGIDAVKRAGLLFDLFANNRAAHITLLGMTGYGKTFFLNLFTLRAAITQGHRVIGIDDFDNGPRIAAAAGAGAACYMLLMETPINILDVVYDDDADGGWLPNQVQHAIAQLSLLLGKPGKTPDGKEYLIPRDFEPEDTGILDRALVRLYRRVTPNTPLDQMPLLSDLIEILERFHEPEAKKLARTLRIKLFGTEDLEREKDEATTVERCFNRHTQVDWRFGSDITYYNTQHVPQMYRPFFYLQIIGAILRFMRSRRPADRIRKTILAIDEFGYVTQIEALARLAATITKVARKYGIGGVYIDQNPLTFLESISGRYIFENCDAVVSFKLKESAARQLAGAIRDMNESHIETLTKFDQGQCMAVVQNDIYIINVEASPREMRAFKGS